MATIRKRKDRWQVQIRRSGYPVISKTFTRRSDALEWARHMDIKADRKDLEPFSCPEAENAIVQDLLEKYITEVLPSKPSRKAQEYILRRFQRHSMAKKKALEITPQDFTAYKEERLAEVSATTFNHQLGIIQHAFETAIKEWQWPLKSNPVKSIRKPKNGAGRTRRLEGGEFEKLVQAAQDTRNPLILPVIRFAVATGMRRGEILRIQWTHIDFTAKTLLIPLTKNGYARTIPLSSNAVAVLQQLQDTQGKGKLVFPMTENAFKLAWQRLRNRSGVEDFHFHDLRHEAISRFFEKGLAVPEVALISGHRDYRMLFRYTHLKPESLVEKLG